MNGLATNIDAFGIALAMVLGFAPALAVCAAYELLAVRRLRKRLAAVEARAEALADLADNAMRMAAGAAASERRAREQVARLTEKLGQVELRSDARGFEQAINLAAQVHGEDVGRLVSCLGLSEGEASLVSLLHGGRLRASRDGRP